MKHFAIAIQPEIPITGIEGGLAELDPRDVEILNKYLTEGWVVLSCNSNHAGALLVCLFKDNG